MSIICCRPVNLIHSSTQTGKSFLEFQKTWTPVERLETRKSSWPGQNCYLNVSKEPGSDYCSLKSGIILLRNSVFYFKNNVEVVLNNHSCFKKFGCTLAFLWNSILLLHQRALNLNQSPSFGGPRGGRGGDLTSQAGTVSCELINLVALWGITATCWKNWVFKCWSNVV